MQLSQRSTVLAVAVALFATVIPPALATYLAGGPPPGVLLDFWLRFHESELCQEIDAVFVFHAKSAEVWCLARDTRALERFRQGADALRSSCPVELYITRPPRDRDDDEDRQPPPSLWNNERLRAHLQEPAVSMIDRQPAGGEEHTPRGQAFPLKSRIQMFADQTLEASRRVRQYASDMHELSGVAGDPAARPETAARARAIFLSHAAALNRSLDRLEDNLKLALPMSSRGVRQADGERSSKALPRHPEPILEMVRVSESIHRRVNRFVYPDEHTVELADLREPNLLGTLAELRRLVLALSKRR